MKRDLVHLFLSLGTCMQVSSSATPWTVALQASLSMGLFRQEYWSGLPFLPPGDLPDSGIEPSSPTSSALAVRFFITAPLRKPRHVRWYEDPASLSFSFTPLQPLSLCNTINRSNEKPGDVGPGPHQLQDSPLGSAPCGAAHKDLHFCSPAIKLGRFCMAHDTCSAGLRP